MLCVEIKEDYGKNLETASTEFMQEYELLEGLEESENGNR